MRLQHSASLHSTSFKGASLATTPARCFRSFASSRRFVVQNRTLWSLEIDKVWCDVNKEKCGDLQPSIDLSESISQNLECLVGETKDCDFAVSCDKTGVKVKFESVGAANPLDSPAELYLTHVGGDTAILVDDQKMELSEKARLKPGSAIQFGDFARFIVLRDVSAHA